MPGFSRSLRLKVSLWTGLALLLLLIPFNFVEYRLHRRAALGELSDLAATTAAVTEQSLQSAMLNRNLPAIQDIVDNVARSPSVRSVYVVNKDAVVAASPNGARNGERLNRADPVCQECHQFPAPVRPRGVVVTSDGQQLFRSVAPIVNQPICTSCHPASQRLNGIIYVDFSMASPNSRVDAALRTALGASALLVLLSMIAVYGLLSVMVITPLEKVAGALRRFSAGERDARAPIHSEDEVGMLSSGFNVMAETIQAQEASAEQLYAELEARDALRRQLLGKVIEAREEERRNLAREIHDELGQMLTGLSLHIRLVQDALDCGPEQVKDYLGRAGALVGETIDRSHRLISDLRPPVLDDYGLSPALREELEHRLAPLGIVAAYQCDGDVDSVPPDVATAAFRISQEAITNIIRHSGARRVWVSVSTADGRLTMMIEDDGAGLPESARQPGSAHHGFGILGMQERAEALGGKVAVARREQGGTAVLLVLPLEMASDRDDTRLAG
ncbi:MAG: ATP-binding protein [Nitrososphaerales archaeon]